jgi:hypothetical protein
MSNMIRNFPIRRQNSSCGLDRQVLACCLVSKFAVYRRALNEENQQASSRKEGNHKKS